MRHFNLDIVLTLGTVFSVLASSADEAKKIVCSDALRGVRIDADESYLNHIGLYNVKSSFHVADYIPVDGNLLVQKISGDDDSDISLYAVFVDLPVRFQGETMQEDSEELEHLLSDECNSFIDPCFINYWKAVKECEFEMCEDYEIKSLL